MSMSGEIIHVHIGQAGVQIGNACWELYCLEHGIDPCGCLYDYQSDGAFSTFFAFSSTPKVVPRAVMVDSEPTVIDEVRTGTYGHLFKPETLITGKEDSGSNFARGYNTVGNDITGITMNAIRCVVETCDNLKGFLFFRSIGGGTGSGLGDRLLEEILDEYGKLAKMEFTIFPSSTLTPLIVEPYNSLLSTHVSMDVIDCSFILDNETLYSICESKLDVISPTFTNINRIIGQAISGLTASQRFYGSANVGFTEFQTNLVPFPRIHFPIMSYAPLSTMCSSCFSELTTDQLTIEAFQSQNQLAKCNPHEGKYMSCVMLYRGNIAPAEIYTSIRSMRMKTELEFVDWSPSGFKIGINNMPPCAVPGGDIGQTDKGVVTLMNNTIISQSWCNMLAKFNDLYSRRTFIHHFTAEGLEEAVFEEASEDICALISDYREVDDFDVPGYSGSNLGNQAKHPATLPSRELSKHYSSNNYEKMIPANDLRGKEEHYSSHMNYEQNEVNRPSLYENKQQQTSLRSDSESWTSSLTDSNNGHFHNYLDDELSKDIKLVCSQKTTTNNFKKECDQALSKNNYKLSMALRHHHAHFNTDNTLVYPKLINTKHIMNNTAIENVQNVIQPLSAKIFETVANDHYSELDRNIDSGCENLKKNAEVPQNVATHKDKNVCYLKNSLKQSVCNNSQNLNAPVEGHNIVEGKVQFTLPNKDNLECKSENEIARMSNKSLSRHKLADSTQDNNSSNGLSDAEKSQDKIRSIDQKTPRALQLQQHSGSNDGQSMYRPCVHYDQRYNRNDCLTPRTLSEVVEAATTTYFSQGTTDAKTYFEKKNENFKMDKSAGEEIDYFSPEYINFKRKKNGITKIRRSYSYHQSFTKDKELSDAKNSKRKIRKIQTAPGLLETHFKENYYPNTQKDCKHNLQKFNQYVHFFKETSEIGCNTSSTLMISKRFQLPEINQKISNVEYSDVLPRVKSCQTLDQSGLNPGFAMASNENHSTHGRNSLAISTTQQLQNQANSGKQKIGTPSKTEQHLTAAGIADHEDLPTKKSNSPSVANFVTPDQYFHQNSSFVEEHYKTKEQKQQFCDYGNKKTKYGDYSARERQHHASNRDCATNTNVGAITSKLERSTSYDNTCFSPIEQITAKPTFEPNVNKLSIRRSAKHFSRKKYRRELPYIEYYISHRNRAINTDNMAETVEESRERMSHVKSLLPRFEHRSSALEKNKLSKLRSEKIREHKRVLKMSRMFPSEGTSISQDQRRSRKRQIDRNNALSQTKDLSPTSICNVGKSNIGQTESSIRENSLSRQRRTCTSQHVTHIYPDDHVSTTWRAAECITPRSQYQNRSDPNSRESSPCMKKESHLIPVMCFKSTEDVLYSSKPQQSQRSEPGKSINSPEKSYIFTPKSSRSREDVYWLFKCHGHKDHSTRLHRIENKRAQTRQTCISPKARQEACYDLKQHQSVMDNNNNSAGNEKQLHLKKNAHNRKTSLTLERYYGENLGDENSSQDPHQARHQKQRIQRDFTNNSGADFPDSTKVSLSQFEHSYRVPVPDNVYRAKGLTSVQDELHYSRIQYPDSSSIRDPAPDETRVYYMLEHPQEFAQHSGPIRPQSPNFETLRNKRSLSEINESLNKRSQDFTESNKKDFFSSDSISNVSKMPSTSEFSRSIGEDKVEFSARSQQPLSIESSFSLSTYKPIYRNSCESIYSTKKDSVEKTTTTHGFLQTRDDLTNEKVKWHPTVPNDKTSERYQSSWKLQQNTDHYSNKMYCVGDGTGMHAVSENCHAKLEGKVRFSKLADSADCHEGVPPQHSTCEQLLVKQERIPKHNISNTDVSSHESIAYKNNMPPTTEYYHENIQRRTQYIDELQRTPRIGSSQNDLSPSKSATDQSLISTWPKHLYDHDAENDHCSWKLHSSNTGLSTGEISGLGSDNHSVTFFRNNSKDHLYTSCPSDTGSIRWMQMPSRSKYGQRERNQDLRNYHSNLYESYSDDESMPVESKYHVVEKHKISSSEIDSDFVTSSQQISETALLREHIAIRKYGKLMTKIPASNRVKRYKVDSLSSVSATCQPRLVDRLQHKVGNDDSLTILKTNSSEDIPEKCRNLLLNSIEASV